MDLFVLESALQHRGTESAGFALGGEGYFFVFADHGSVYRVYTEYVDRCSYKASRGIGHNRYSTTGPSERGNAQPIKVGSYCIGHNGNLSNGLELRERYSQDFEFKTTTDTEIMGHFLDEGGDPFKGAERIFGECQGAFNLVAMNNRGEVVLIRDPRGFHPFVWTGMMSNGRAYAASENIALATLGIYGWEDVPPGEVIVFRKDGQVDRKNFSRGEDLCRCPMEVLYFMRHGSMYTVGGEKKLVVDTRRQWGEMLDKKYPLSDVDVRSYIPRSGMGYAMNDKLVDVFSANPFADRIYLRPHRKGETTSSGLDLSRLQMSMIKNPVIQAAVKGKRIGLKDDSMVRLNNSKAQAQSLFEAGAESVFFQIAAPPIRYPCFTGMDHSQRKTLAAARYDTIKDANDGVSAQIAEHCGVSGTRVGVGFLSLEEMLEPLGGMCRGRCGSCTACFTGDYPFDIPASLKDNMKLE